MVVSEQVKIRYLMRKRYEAKKCEKAGIVTLSFGVAIVIMSLFVIHNGFETAIGALGLVGAINLVIFGFGAAAFYNTKYIHLTKALRSVGGPFLKCPKCHYRPLKDNFKFCPNCGTQRI